MRRTKHRRRFHTDRVIANRQRRYRREESGWVVRDGWARHLEDGRLANDYAYFGCGRPRCYLCHFEKLIGDRRTREKRAWRREVADQAGA